jgi:hypothetical protein
MTAAMGVTGFVKNIVGEKSEDQVSTKAVSKSVSKHAHAHVTKYVCEQVRRHVPGHAFCPHLHTGDKRHHVHPRRALRCEQELGGGGAVGGGARRVAARLGNSTPNPSPYPVYPVYPYPYP